MFRLIKLRAARKSLARSPRRFETYAILIGKLKWCPVPESNQHSSRNLILSQARLPIPPRGHPGIWFRDIGSCYTKERSFGQPVFAKIAISRKFAWRRCCGLMDVTPDTVPVISPVTSISGLHLAVGFSGHGFGIGPGAGALMADLVTGTTPSVDSKPFRLERFRRATSLKD